MKQQTWFLGDGERLLVYPGAVVLEKGNKAVILFKGKVTAEIVELLVRRFFGQVAEREV